MDRICPIRLVFRASPRYDAAARDRERAVLLIPCPWCGPRDEVEFRYGGQAGIAYPKDPDALTDAEWADYLFMRDNPKGPFRERWVHAAGCRRWFDVTRDTVTNEILA